MHACKGKSAFGAPSSNSRRPDKIRYAPPRVQTISLRIASCLMPGMTMDSASMQLPIMRMMNSNQALGLTSWQAA